MNPGDEALWLCTSLSEEAEKVVMVPQIADDSETSIGVVVVSNVQQEHLFKGAKEPLQTIL